jgi:hypothetical protein
MHTEINSSIQGDIQEIEIKDKYKMVYINHMFPMLWHLEPYQLQRMSLPRLTISER